MNIKKAVEKALTVRSAFDAEVEGVRSDRALSPEGRRVRIAWEYVGTTSALAKIRKDLEAAEANSWTLLERQLFRPPVPVGVSPSERVAVDASFRDAMDRAAAAAGDGALLELFGRASRSGDAIQAHAAMVLAAEREDVDVLNAYVEEHPAIEADLQRFLDMSPSRSQAFRDELGRAMALADPATPRELEGLWPGELAELADGEASMAVVDAAIAAATQGGGA